MNNVSIVTLFPEAAQAVSGSSNTAAANADFSSYLKSEKTLDDIFNEASQTYGVSADLLKAIAKQESNFRADATSRSGAQGIMQLMPRTASGLGVSDAYDPYQNIMGGAKYISQMLTKYNGDTSLALAAYNAGSNNVDKYGGIPPFQETQNYVVKVTQYLNEGVSVPDTAYSGTSKIPGDSGVSYQDLNGIAKEILDQIFSYDKYIDLIEELLKDKEQSLDISVKAPEQAAASVITNSSADSLSAAEWGADAVVTGPASEDTGTGDSASEGYRAYQQLQNVSAPYHFSPDFT